MVNTYTIFAMFSNIGEIFTCRLKNKSQNNIHIDTIHANSDPLPDSSLICPESFYIFYMLIS